jgi:hypothetical protein
MVKIMGIEFATPFFMSRLGWWLHLMSNYVEYFVEYFLSCFQVIPYH